VRIIEIDKSIKVADDVRSLTRHASGMPLSEAVKDLAAALSKAGFKWALCGGLAVGVHARPRGTDDVDIIVDSEDSVEAIALLAGASFKRARAHAITHKRTGVEVELLTAAFLKVPDPIVQKALLTASHAQVGAASIPVVSREGLVAMKLARSEYQDLADIAAITRMGGPVDMSGWPITEAERETLAKASAQRPKGPVEEETPSEPAS
jgi:hypothetical protein